MVAPYARDALVCDLAPALSHRGMDLQAKQAWLDTWEGHIDRESRYFSVVSGDLGLLPQLLQSQRNSQGGPTDQLSGCVQRCALHREGCPADRPRARVRAPFAWMDSLRPASDLKP
jgi:ketosteroid isomerase-like protein